MRFRSWAATLSLAALLLTAAPAAGQWPAARVALPLDHVTNYGKPRAKPERFELLEASGLYVFQARRIKWNHWTQRRTIGYGQWRRCPVAAIKCGKWRHLTIALSDLESDCARKAVFHPYVPPALWTPAQPALPLYHRLEMWMRSYDRRAGHYIETLGRLLAPCAGPLHTHPPRDCGEHGGAHPDSMHCRGDHNTPLRMHHCRNRWVVDYFSWLHCRDDDVGVW